MEYKSYICIPVSNMENKINISAIELYARKALKPLLDNYFTKAKISGSEIVEFSPIEQLNYFIIYELFSKWLEETSKLRSPYFDYEHEKVKEALNTFMGQLSQHILVNRENFSPLLQNAIYNTLFFSLSPLQFLEQRYFKSDKNYTSEELKNTLKYLKAHPSISNYGRENIENWNNKNGKEILDSIKSHLGQNPIEKESGENVVNGFNTVLPVSTKDFYYNEAAKNASAATPQKEEPKLITLNDLIGKDQRATTINLHTKNKIVDIRSAMSINQKFMFIKELFRGDHTAFETAMSLADRSNSYESAVNALIDNYSQRFGWMIDSDEVNELFDLIGRKFFPENSEQKK